MADSTERWGTRIGLVLAMAGNAIGLGNFLRFPAQAAANGGGAFLLPYLVAFLLMGMPLLWVEWAIGRHGGAFGHHSTPGQFDRLGRSPLLKYVGVLGLFTTLAIAAYYCYVESWTLAWVWHSLRGTFATTPPAEVFDAHLGLEPEALLATPRAGLAFFLVTLALNVWVLSRGLAAGIEKAARILMPLLLLFAGTLAVRGLMLRLGSPGVVESPLVGLAFVWEPNLSGLIDPGVWLAAAGQVFFTLSLGMGSIHCYASYLRRDDDIALNAAAAGWLNELVEVVLGSAILIPIATAYLGLEAVRSATAGGSGFALGFLTLPTLFANDGWLAPIWGVMWFGLLFFAGITSSLAMGQPLLAFLEDELAISRRTAASIFGLAAGTLGLVAVFLYPSGGFDELDFWTGTVALVVFAFAELMIVLHVFGIDRFWDEITRGAELELPRGLRFVLRFVTPTFLGAVLVAASVRPAADDWGGAVRSLANGDGWPLDAGSILGRLFHVGATDGWFDAAGDPTRRLVEDGTRGLLLALLLALGLLVRVAWKRKAPKSTP